MQCWFYLSMVNLLRVVMCVMMRYVGVRHFPGFARCIFNSSHLKRCVWSQRQALFSVPADRALNVGYLNIIIIGNNKKNVRGFKIKKYIYTNVILILLWGGGGVKKEHHWGVHDFITECVSLGTMCTDWFVFRDSSDCFVSNLCYWSRYKWVIYST